jgi:hypothetical protein
MFVDNTTEWLPLSNGTTPLECKFRFPSGSSVARSYGQYAVERKLVLQAFDTWLREDPATGADLLVGLDVNMEMHPLHRIYWAIRSNRPKLAMVLMRRWYV